MSPEIDATKRGWLGRKYYLSPEAIELLESHCKGTPLTMSAYLDMLIKQNLAAATNAPSKLAQLQQTEPPAVAEERARKAALARGVEEARKVIKQEKPFDL